MNPQWKNMIQTQIVERGIREARVLRAMSEIDRSLFVPERYRSRSYEDGPLPIGFEQIISQPYIVAFMTEVILPATDGEPTRALELGAGCGYQSAILSRIFSRVTSFELVPELAELAKKNLDALKIDNVEIISGDGSRGMPGKTFHGILGAAAFSKYPEHLEQQLEPGGKMVLPAGKESQYLYLSENSESGFLRKQILAVRFVPMISED